ncbi:FtsX-like permease family protein [Streptomyces tubbatahanensis]|uniref:FtsX-like permease family protein n=2 Tax=Streptomyces tubbatahanensis TaxID=2923272 RepID=A0ABY3XRN6_9ACTN|nr:FtsX-like permease family protein [Streptomyces tubbatahanensis]UNS97014.1 FtsX-like permease family protein [Streptomyces tubbatahanensis]
MSPHGTLRPRAPWPVRMLPNGLARSAVRAHPVAFAGTFVALTMTAMIISACAFLADTGARARAVPHRYADVPAVVTADQRAHLFTGSGEAREDVGETVPERARIAVGKATATARAVAGVARVVPDVTATVGAHHPAATLTGHGWGSAAFTGTELTAGAPPRTDRDAVLDADTAAARGLAPGDTLRLTTAEGDRAFRVTGVARAGREDEGTAAWFSDAGARALAGHPSRADALAVLTAPGADTEAVASRLRHALGEGPVVRTGQAKGAAEGADVAYGKEALEALGVSFGALAALTAVFTASGTVALSLTQRRREFALLRAVGATPRQIRRTVATEALLVAPLAGVLGCLPGAALARWWFGALRERDAVPKSVHLHLGATSVAVAVGVTVGTALLAGHLAARRPARTRPKEALGDAARERFRPGVVRTLLGLGALAGGLAMVRVAGREGGEDAANLALGVVLLLMTAVALLGQYVAKACSWLLGLPLRAGSAASALAAAGAWANARRLASALTPVVLAMSFGCTLLFLQTSEDWQTDLQQRAGLRADHIVTGSGGDESAGLPRTAAERAARTPGVSAAVGVLRTTVLVEIRSGGTFLQTADAQGVSEHGGRLSAVEDLGVSHGSLDDLRDGTVAIDRLVARGARVGLGERIGLRLPDGTEARPEVVAVHTRGTGLSPIVLDRATLEGHLASPYDAEVLVRQEPGADTARVTKALSALGEVLDTSAWTRAADRDRAVNRWGNLTMALVLGCFAAVAAANTLVMTVAGRRREMAALRLLGATRGQVLRMVHWEAALITVSALALGTGIALLTLRPMTEGLFQAPPHVPPALYAAIAATVTVLTFASTTVPARAVLPAPAPAARN